jgi:hypothetical protein
MTAIGDPHALSTLAHALHEQSDRLEAASSRLEQVFLSTADDIMTITGSGRDLIARSHDLVEMAVGHRGGAVVTEATAVLREPIAFLTDGVARMRRVIELLSGQHERLRKALRAERDLRTVMAPMTYVRTLLCIEGARLDGTEAQKLGDLARDIESMQSRLEEVFDQQFRDLQSTETSFGELLARLRAQSAAHETEAAARHREIETALSRMEQGTSESERGESQLAEISREVGAEVSRVVLALQFQDIVSQKLAHVRATVAEMQRPLIGLVDGAERSGEDLRFVEQAGRIVLGQLEAAEVELGSADETVADGLRVIVARVKALDEAALSMYDVDSVTAGVDGFVQVMLEAIQQIAALLESGTRLAAEAHVVVAPIHVTAGAVAQRIGSLASGMHLVGLNAEVQTAHIQSAGGLEVLSARLSEISRETGALSAEVAKDIDGIVRTIGEAEGLLRQLRTHGARHATEVRDSATSVSGRLHEYRDSTLDSVVGLGEVAARLHEQVRPLMSRPPWRALFTEEMEGLRGAVAAVVERMAAAAEEQGVPSDAARARVEAVAGRYTMASERRVHDARLKGEVAHLRRSVRGGSVDLFGDDEPSAAGEPPTEPPQSGPAAGDVELF